MMEIRIAGIVFDAAMDLMHIPMVALATLHRVELAKGLAVMSGVTRHTRLPFRSAHLSQHLARTTHNLCILVGQ
jgi:hypothetical protein